ncbi:MULTISPECIES: DinB family protein [Priestia]|uniref:DinB family protein n=1 Tax=Priestia TaxID=2800373 RepID=UPI00203E4899|nr:MULTISPECIES: DinB family protein [Priestia]MCM3771182.1 DinB family protein [Priestia aryabhattai]MDY0942609.1 DinB family protein [Priestia megaterium]
MEDTILKHMDVVRGITTSVLEKTTEEAADITPKGFNNNIRWNLGHIAFIQEKLVFGLAGEPMQTPESYESFFGAGTKPADWTETPPSLEEIANVLRDQASRIKEFMPQQFNKQLITPFTNKAGINFTTVDETFLFSFYHEAMHVETIKQIRKAAQ